MYYGKVAGELATLACSADAYYGASYCAVIGIGFAATAIASIFVTRIARRALQEVTG